MVYLLTKRRAGSITEWKESVIKALSARIPLLLSGMTSFVILQSYVSWACFVNYVAVPYHISAASP
jgi:hypothetical protein